MRTLSPRPTIARRATFSLAALAVVGTLAAGCGSSSSKSDSGVFPGNAPSSTASTQPDSPSQTPSTSADDSSTDDSSSSNKSTEYKRVLLTASEVSDITGETFTKQPSSDDSSSSDEPSGCSAVDEFAAAAKDSGSEKASVSFANADQSQEAEEQLTYVPGKAEDLFTQLKDAIGSCESLGTGDNSLTLAVQDDPEVADADDTASFTASATASGKSIVITVLLARYGDNIVQVTYSAVGEEDSPIIGDTELLTEAASKAAPALS